MHDSGPVDLALSILSGMHLECCSGSRLANPIPLDSLDSFIQSLRCPEILQDPIAVFGSSISYQCQNGGITLESLSFGGLARYAYSGRILAGPFLEDTDTTGRALAIALAEVS
jgi:hypothetical protein